ncbi:MAG TPA: TIGR03086 family metal-binding protein [Candidatus Saccharimonadales bacterium]|nr:TIGR03086 family metal-binding protein [Candidatus Saccharimonadales bacterium]
MDGSELFAKCLEQATAIVKQVRTDQLVNATPDTDWNVRDLAHHMLYELSWVPAMVEGLTIDEVGDKYEDELFDEDGGDLIANWERAASKADQAVLMADLEEVAHVSYGDISIENYLYQIGGDLLIHAWDLAKGIGFPIQFDPAVAQEIYEHTLPQQANMKASGLFASPIDVPNTADLQTRLLGLFGRRADWQAS